VLVSLIFVAVGGASGAVSRYLLVMLLTPTITAPWATFSINVLGCGVAGLVAGYFVESQWFQNEGRVLIMVGFLGGFTTFSAFSLDFFQLMANQKITQAMLYAAMSVLCTVIAFGVGYKLFEHHA